MKIYIGADHGGFKLKTAILENNELKSLDFEIIDKGAYELNTEDDYTDFAIEVAKAVANDSESRGILICRSGIGMCIAANKIKGAYAGLAFTKHHAEMARKDDNANILCLDADYESEDPIELIKIFLQTDFAGMDTRHGRRFMKIKEVENL
jgi:ribose 5-phosphate isomerase B